MAEILFYEKPRCAGNARQRHLLEAAGHRVIARDLLSEAWTAERLHGFLAARPVAEWFNPASPRIKSGEIRPDCLDAASAMAALLADPLLIRRPLIEADGHRDCGFDLQRLATWIDLPAPSQAGGIESCPRSDTAPTCHSPERP